MQARDYYLEKVFPKLRLPLAEKYPLVSLEECAGLRALGQHPLLMLVALTGTGKSTTLELLQRRLGTGCADVIPSRRELTDWILIPLAQALADEPLGAGAGSRSAFWHHAALCGSGRRRHGGCLLLAILVRRGTGIIALRGHSGTQ